MKRVLWMWSILAVVAYVVASCGYPSYTPTLRCNGANDYWVEEGGCASYAGNYGHTFEEALDSFMRSEGYDLSPYPNHYFENDTVHLHNHPDSHNRSFIEVRLYRWDESPSGGYYQIWLWDIIDTKGDVYTHILPYD